MKSVIAIFFCLLLLWPRGLHAAPQEQKDAQQNPAAIVRLNAADFGFLPKASAATNTVALQRISKRINSLGGGVVLSISKGTYTVGRERFAGKSGLGFSYIGDTLLRIAGCTKPVVIDGNGATIRLANGLHFGSFDAQSGKAYQAKGGGFYQYDYASYPQILIDLTGNQSVTIRNLTLDGNVQNAVLGGYWGDTGIQLPADGILGRENVHLVLDKVTSRYFFRDGLQIVNTTPDEKAAVKKVFLTNCRFEGNTRQGMSWVGGNHLHAVGCHFTGTGKTINKQSGQPAISAPAAGIDMEAEAGLVRNGLYEDCVIDNNAGAGLLSVGDVSNIRYLRGKIIGATNWSIYGSGPNAVFDKTTIVGSPVNLRVGAGPSDPVNAKLNNCLITMDTALSPTGKAYGSYVMDFGGGAGGHFVSCIIDSKNRGSVYGGWGCTFTDCTFRQAEPAPGYNGYPFMSGTFYGTNRLYRPGVGSMLPNLEKSVFYGPFYVNDVKVADKK